MLFYDFETVSVNSERSQQGKQRYSIQNSMICQQWTLGSPKSLKFTVYVSTFLHHTVPLRVRMFWKSPDSYVSDNIDEVLKKSHQKILSSRRDPVNFKFGYKVGFFHRKNPTSHEWNDLDL